MNKSANRGVGIVVNPKKAELAGRLQEDPYRAQERFERMTSGPVRDEAEEVTSAVMADQGYSSMGNGCFKRSPVFNN